MSSSASRERDGIDLDQTIWFNADGGEVYHSDAPWGPGCPEHRNRCEEHTLEEAADAGKRPCKSCHPPDYRPLVADGGEEQSAAIPQDMYIRTIPFAAVLTILGGVLGLGWLSASEGLTFISGVAAMHAGIGVMGWFS